MIKSGQWYVYAGRTTRQLKTGTAVRVVDAEGMMWQGQPHALVWPMGDARTEDEAGILVAEITLSGSGVGSAAAARQQSQEMADALEITVPELLALELEGKDFIVRTGG